MKLIKFIFPAIFALGMLASCSDEPSGPSTKEPNTGPEQPSTPTEPTEPEKPGSDVVSPTATFSLVTYKTEVNPDEKLQMMEGFGASDCWLPAQIGKYWRTNRLQIASWLFSRGIVKGRPNGIGLSMWRVNLGAGTFEQGSDSNIDQNNRAECYLNGTNYDWTKCEGQRYFMQQAKNNGVESFVLFSNSPLVQWTKNGKGYSKSGANANLKDEYYDDFAEYMATVADHFNKEGYNVSHISPVNEPQYNWDGTAQEGSGWKNSEIAKLVKELDKALGAKNSTTKILIPEAAAWGYLYEGNVNDRANQIKAFFDPTSSSYVGDLSHVDKLVGGHSYWTFDNWNDMRNVRDRAGKAAAAAGLRVWQTEWSMLDREPSEIGKSYDDMSEFEIALYMSKVIHNDIVKANCSSWSYWTAMSVERYSQKNRFELIKTTPAGGHYSDDFTAEGKIEATDNLWVLGNYSLFVRPGYQRIGLKNSNESKNFFGTAYASPDGKTIVAVYTNADTEKGVLLDNSFAGAGTLSKVWRYTTTANKHLEGEQFNPADKVFVEPFSVTTVVYTFE